MENLAIGILQIYDALGIGFGFIYIYAGLARRACNTINNNEF